MPAFPTQSADVLALVKTMAAGFSAHPEIFPNPPHPADDLHAEAESYAAEHEANVEAQARAGQTKEAEKHLLERIKTKANANVAYVIHTTHEERELNLVGWSNRSAPTPPPRPNNPCRYHRPAMATAQCIYRGLRPMAAAKCKPTESSAAKSIPMDPTRNGPCAKSLSPPKPP